jgi:hypothetical protein
MSPRAGHLPNIYERTVLQMLRRVRELPAAELPSTSSQTIKKLLAKGWIEHGSSHRVFRITPTGEAALRAELPMDKGNRPAIQRARPLRLCPVTADRAK